jgi:hypothetical protein
MCWSCGCDDDLEDDHGDDRNITTSKLEDAASARGGELDDVIQSINKAWSHFDSSMVKSVDEPVYYSCIKSASSQHYTLGVAYPANKPDGGRAADGYRDFITEEALEKAAWGWLKNSRRVNLFHDASKSSEGHFTPTESYIYRGPDWEIKAADGRTYLVKAGDWLVGGIWDDVGWAAVTGGIINGWSPEGRVARQRAQVDERSLRRANGY